jgi:hypothetical protein
MRAPASNLGAVFLGCRVLQQWRRYRHRPALWPDIGHSVEVSPSLIGNSWTTDGVTHLRTVNGDPETWTASATLPVSDTQFFRLKIIQLP